MLRALTIASVAGLAACSPREEAAPPETAGGLAEAREAVFECGGRWVQVRLTAERARLVVSSMTFDLLKVEADSGARYEARGDEETFFWDRGDTALVSLNGEVLPECERAGG